MNSIERQWLKVCQVNPEKYKIIVDNDGVFVDDMATCECVFSFDDYGQYFIEGLLRYIGCNAEQAQKEKANEMV